jgi:hypothetical protein
MMLPGYDGSASRPGCWSRSSRRKLQRVVHGFLVRREGGWAATVSPRTLTRDYLPTRAQSLGPRPEGAERAANRRPVTTIRLVAEHIPARAAPRGYARRRRPVSWMVMWTVRVQPLYPVPAPVAPRRCAGCIPYRVRGAAGAPRRLGYPQLRCLAERAAVIAPRHPGRHRLAARPRRACRPGLGAGAQARRRWHRRVAADQAEVQVPALRATISPLDPGRDDVWVAWQDDAPGRQPVQAGAYRALRQAGVADQRGHRGERARPVRPGVVGQADEHELARAR